MHISEDAIIQASNDAMLAILGKDRSVIGTSLKEALPELKGQPFIEMLKRAGMKGSGPEVLKRENRLIGELATAIEGLNRANADLKQAREELSELNTELEKRVAV